MNNDSLKNALIKNRVLDNSSNFLSKVHFDNHYDESIININTGGYLNNGYIYIDIQSTSKFELYYKDILLLSTNVGTQKLIPCLFESDTYIRIVGACENLTILIYGAEVINDNKFYHLPMNNTLVKFGGGKYDFYTYESQTDIENNLLTFAFDVADVIDVQTIHILGTNYLSYLYYDDSLKLATSMDNYTNKYIIIEENLPAKIIPDGVNNKIYIVYIRANKLYYKVIDESFNISDEYEIPLIFDDVLKDFSVITIKNYSLPIFALNLNNQKSLIMVLYNGQFVCRLIKKSEKTNIYVNGDLIEIYSFDNNELNISKFLVLQGSGVTIKSIVSPKSIYNVDRLIKFDDNYMLFNRNFCTIISDDRLFSN